ncbi:MAG: hypothetical protein LBQ83_02955 [Candidatus Margulisbacteria bacterium]|jgi:hypothetical protein|nr:hypothetical protein [Candidatus Margulisiibacteriota bacterium]
MMRKLPLLLFLLLLTACGRIITDKTLTDDSGNVISARYAEFTFTFAEDPAMEQNYKYYLIITTANATGELLNMLSGTDSNLNYFASPDDTAASTNARFMTQYYGSPSPGDYDNMQRVYLNFFSKWAQYYIYDNSYGDYNLGAYSGPYVWADPLPYYDVQRINLRPNYPARPAANQLRLTINLPPYNNFYFGLLAVYDGNSDSTRRLIVDGLGLIPVDAQSSGQIYYNEADPTTETPISSYKGLDITNYTVRIME